MADARQHRGCSEVIVVSLFATGANNGTKSSIPVQSA
jgi:hypothetical protein